jgi:LPXTG-motif cell wall-anchored protein
MPPAEQSTPPQLAETGSANTGTMLAASAASAALIGGGALLYRRGRVISSRR